MTATISSTSPPATAAVHRAESRAGWWFITPTLLFLLVTGIFPLGTW